MSTPRRIMIIRHAEKPDGTDAGVSKDGTPDKECLITRGWQRAGALVRFFAPVGGSPMTPTIVYASGIGDHSKSHRPKETVDPLVALLGVPFNTRFLKKSTQALVTDVLQQTGIVLIAWEHELIPQIVGLLPDPPIVPQTWPDDRFDIVWICDAVAGGGWTFSQVPQLLLAGDQERVIT